MPEYAFVDATANSGPAWMSTKPSTVFAMRLDRTLSTPSVRAPALTAASSATCVSAVSPDWLTATTSVRGPTTPGTTSYSLAGIMRAGTPANALDRLRAVERGVRRRAARDQVDALDRRRGRRR